MPTTTHFGNFQGHSIQEVIIGNYQLDSIGNPNLENVTSISFNVYSQTGSNVQITLGGMVAATTLGMSNILSGATVSELGLGNLSNWSTPNPEVAVHALGQSNSSALVTMRIPATQTQYALFEAQGVNLFNCNFIYFQMRVQATVPLHVSIVFQQNSTTFTEYAAFNAGYFANGTMIELAIKPTDLLHFGSGTILGANVVSIDVYSSRTANATISVYEIAAVGVLG